MKEKAYTAEEVEAHWGVKPGEIDCYANRFSGGKAEWYNRVTHEFLPVKDDAPRPTNKAKRKRR